MPQKSRFNTIGRFVYRKISYKLRLARSVSPQYWFKSIHLERGSCINIAKGVRISNTSIIKVSENARLLIGEGSSIGDYVTMNCHGNSQIGRNCRINQRSVLSGTFSLGNYVMLAPSSALIGDHHRLEYLQNSDLCIDELDTIHGMRRGRIEIGDHSIIGLGSVVYGPCFLGKRVITNTYTVCRGTHKDQTTVR